jgi:hypothetical protein
MTLIEAAKLALEALENTSPLGFNMERDKQFYAAITALRTAIADAEKQEPVAWKDTTYGNLHHQNFGGCIPLYTTPPAAQRQPLTDDEIDELVQKNFGFITAWQGPFVRAIEAAHGIKEKHDAR